MNIYHIWANPKKETDKSEFLSLLKRFLDLLVEKNLMVSYRITQMKLGFRSLDLPEYHIMMEFKTMQHLDNAMDVTLLTKEVDAAHVSFNKLVDTDSMHHALYRDVDV
jgi:hypothetical protein